MTRTILMLTALAGLAVAATAQTPEPSEQPTPAVAQDQVQTQEQAQAQQRTGLQVQVQEQARIDAPRTGRRFVDDDGDGIYDKLGGAGPRWPGAARRQGSARWRSR